MDHRIPKNGNEQQVHEDVVGFLRTSYPLVLFRTDFAAGIKLPPWLARRQKMLQCRKGFPDLFIYEPVMRPEGDMYHGLALELKAEGVELKRQNGHWQSDHVRTQYYMLKDLSELGYAASFAVGLEQAKAVIKWYLDSAEDIEFDDFVPKVTLGDVVETEEAF
jgi:hypothetical protein